MIDWFALDLAHRTVLVVGAGTEAIPVVTELLQRRAAVTVLGGEVSTSIRDLAQRHLLELAEVPFDAVDLTGFRLVVAATGDPGRDAAVRARADRAGVIAVGRLPTAVPAPTSEVSAAGGRVVLVGGGPGDPGLLTLAGLEAIRTADVVVVDRLAPLSALSQARPDALVVDVGKIPRGEHTPQDVINALLVEHALAGRVVVRLKGGDNFIFGRGGEEWQACAEAGVPVTVIPGVSSATAAPAVAGIPLTHRQWTHGFTVISGHLAPDDPRTKLDWAGLAGSRMTLVILMGMANLPAIVARLLEHGMAPATPAAVVADGTLPSMRSVRGRVDEIVAHVAAEGIGPPAVVVVGAVAAFSREPPDRTPPSAGG